jgi:glutamate racemase
VKDSLDTLVLGCTHYPFAAPAIREALGREIPLLDGGKAIARRTQQLLEEKQLLSPGNGELVWENTLGTPRILALSRRLLDTRIDL